MLDLTNDNLRVRDVRKLVEPSLHMVEWVKPSDKQSEWVHIESEKSCKFWLSSLPIKRDERVYYFDKSWSKTEIDHFRFVSEKFQQILDNKFSLFISQYKTWVIEVHPIKVARFGYWS